jgi:hypothetical protein
MIRASFPAGLPCHGSSLGTCGKYARKPLDARLEGPRRLTFHFLDSLFTNILIT